MREASTRIVWDNHGCMPLRPGDGHFLDQLARYAAAGVDIVSLNVGFGSQSLEQHVRMLAWFRQWVKARGDRYVLVDSAAAAEAVAGSGRLGICFDVEGMAFLEHGDFGVVELLYDLGVRWMLFAYNRNSPTGGGCQDSDQGLTPFGRQVLREMERVGMIACCSHAGERTALDVIEQARAPVILSHSNARALRDNPRNVSDHVIRACAATGGVIGINGFGIFLGENDASTEAVLRHVDHMVQLVGPDHVGFGLDYVFDTQELKDHIATMRRTFPDAADYPEEFAMVEPERVGAIAAALAARGYDRAAVDKILGGNWLRVARSCWKAPRSRPG